MRTGLTLWVPGDVKVEFRSAKPDLFVIEKWTNTNGLCLALKYIGKEAYKCHIPHDEVYATIHFTLGPQTFYSQEVWKLIHIYPSELAEYLEQHDLINTELPGDCARSCGSSSGLVDPPVC
jgi:hypothetical protein